MEMKYTKRASLWPRLRRVRQAVQVLAFALYVYLLFAALQRRAAFPLADLFFRLNPLAALSAMIADRAWIPRLALALITLALTLLLGRAWCGWICPLGTLLEWVRFPVRARSPRPYWRKVKNVFLILILAMALFGSLTLLIFDPITLLTRTMTAAVLPALNQAVTATERALYPVAFVRPVISWVERVLRGPVLPVVQPVFDGGAFIFLLFLSILALNALADRFWCRYLCPLGGLLGLLSKVSLLRPVIQPACNRCGHCVRDCRLDAIDTGAGYEIAPSECTVCLDCLAACPESGIGFEWRWRPAPTQEYDPTRRQVLAVLGISAVSLALLRTDAWAKKPDAHFIRPPGVEDEDEFLSRCVRCSQCMKVCPTSGLQPALFEIGLEGLWTPHLVSRLGYCDYGCNACGQICPSGAIPPLSLEEKQARVIGMAVVDRNRCLPWAYETPCIVCEEMCPLPEKAIQLEDTGLTDDFGQEIRRPYVIL
ncbi:MAG: 4Fe-4S binding protein, partial [Anaerolineae bacterium]|nr:4Fe-4S binding protein [Anaerolineae bacterium]